MYTLKLDSVRKSDRKAGAKAAVLGELISAKIPVPSGFVITAEAFEKFLSINNIKEKLSTDYSSINMRGMESVLDVSSRMQETILSAYIPDFLEKEIKEAYDELSVGREAREAGGIALDMIRAGRGQEYASVRLSMSSAYMFYCGQSRTNLNIMGITSILNSIKECWASMFTPSAIYYMRSKGITTLPYAAVLVQKMIDPEKSGTIYPHHPTSNDRSQMIIESCWGIGDSITSGTITPDQYVISRETGNVSSKRIARKIWKKNRDSLTGKTVNQRVSGDRTDSPVLSEGEIYKLWELYNRIESIANCPQEIEWCMERNRIHVIKSSPLNPGKQGNDSQEEQKGRVIVSGEGASKGFGKGNVRIIGDFNEFGRLGQGNVLVSKTAIPDLIPLAKRASAVVTDTGGITSRLSQACRDFGIPYVTGAENASTLLQENAEVMVDPSTGSVYEKAADPPAAPQAQATQMHAYQDISQEYAYVRENQEQNPQESVIKDDGIIATEVRLALSFPLVNPEIIPKSDGVGMLKAENMLTEGGKNPIILAMTEPDTLVQMIADGIRKVARAFYPKMVWYRSLDIRTDELSGLLGGEEEQKESNPAIGLHGIRRSLKQPEILKAEIAAIRTLLAEGLNNVGLLLSFVSKPEEFRGVKMQIDFPLKLGIVVETPASALQIEEFCREGIRYAYIDINGLSQLSLGADISNPSLVSMHMDTDPSVIFLARRVIDTCRNCGADVSVGGDYPSTPSGAQELVMWGTKSLSVDPDMVNDIKAAVSRTERSILLNRMRQDIGQ